MSLTTLRLPAVVRAATELADKTLRYRPEVHLAIVAAQADPANHPEPSLDE